MASLASYAKIISAIYDQEGHEKCSISTVTLIMCRSRWSEFRFEARVLPYNTMTLTCLPLDCAVLRTREGFTPNPHIMVSQVLMG